MRDEDGNVLIYSANDRGDRGNVGIIRSPIRASILPDRTARHARAVAEIDEPAIGMNMDRADELDRKLVGGVGESVVVVNSGWRRREKSRPPQLDQ